MRGPLDIPFPLSTFPGSTPQESAGRLINCHAEPLGPNGPSKAAWHRSPGLTQFGNATTGNTGYRGGLIVNNIAFEAWANNASTVDGGGNVTSLGNLPGTLKISIARNQNGSGADVVACDIGSGPFVLQAAGVPGSPSPLSTPGLPTPSSVAFQDGYFFFLAENNTLFASPINALSPFNSLTFVVLSAKADVIGQRVIAFSGLIFGFTSGTCEVWQDTAQPFPAFPYSRLLVIPWGLLQPNAIAGFETGFDDLLWVAQDFGVYRLPYGSVSPTKVSPPDLDRLVKTQAGLGNVLEASCYAFAGKKFWALSSPAWTWEFNLGSSQWNERQSLVASTGLQGRWRASGGHLAFGSWLVGDAQSGKLGFVDDTSIMEFGAPQLRRIESGPVADFPNRLRVARADFNFATGAGNALGATPNLVNPSVAISWSDDDGVSWGNPLIRSLGLQGKSLRTRVSVKNTGTSGPQARRWRLDDTDCSAPFMSATQSDDPREY